MARETYEQYFRVAQAMPRGVVAKLCNIIHQMECVRQKQAHPDQVKAAFCLFFVSLGSYDLQFIDDKMSI